MSTGLCVRTSLEENIIVKWECRDCMIKIGKAQLIVDLVVMPLQDFELILGMN